MVCPNKVGRYPKAKINSVAKKQIGLPSGVLVFLCRLGAYRLPCCISSLAILVCIFANCLDNMSRVIGGRVLTAEMSMGSSCLCPSLWRASSTSSLSSAVDMASTNVVGQERKTALAISLLLSPLRKFLMRDFVWSSVLFSKGKAISAKSLYFLLKTRNDSPGLCLNVSSDSLTCSISLEGKKERFK